MNVIVRIIFIVFAMWCWSCGQKIQPVKRSSDRDQQALVALEITSTNTPCQCVLKPLGENLFQCRFIDAGLPLRNAGGRENFSAKWDQALPKSSCLYLCEKVRSEKPGICNLPLGIVEEPGNPLPQDVPPEGTTPVPEKTQGSLADQMEEEIDADLPTVATVSCELKQMQTGCWFVPGNNPPQRLSTRAACSGSPISATDVQLATSWGCRELIAKGPAFSLGSSSFIAQVHAWNTALAAQSPSQIAGRSDARGLSLSSIYADIPSLSHTWVTATGSIKYRWGGRELEHKREGTISWLPANGGINPNAVSQTGYNYAHDETIAYMKNAMNLPVGELLVAEQQVREQGFSEGMAIARASRPIISSIAPGRVAARVQAQVDAIRSQLLHDATRASRVYKQTSFDPVAIDELEFRKILARRWQLGGTGSKFTYSMIEGIGANGYDLLAESGTTNCRDAAIGGNPRKVEFGLDRGKEASSKVHSYLSQNKGLFDTSNGLKDEPRYKWIFAGSYSDKASIRDSQCVCKTTTNKQCQLSIPSRPDLNATFAGDCAEVCAPSGAAMTWILEACEGQVTYQRDLSK